MAKYFGMKFQYYSLGREFYDLPDLEILSATRLQHIPLKTYIHPNSLHLLEPQVGDLVKWKGGDYRKPDPNFDSNFIERIIERNGIPFMQPQKETDNGL
jgi:hypothetical protein